MWSSESARTGSIAGTRTATARIRASTAGFSRWRLAPGTAFWPSSPGRTATRLSISGHKCYIPGQEASTVDGHGKVTMFESVGCLAASHHPPTLRQLPTDLQGLRQPRPGRTQTSLIRRTSQDDSKLDKSGISGISGTVRPLYPEAKNPRWEPVLQYLFDNDSHLALLVRFGRVRRVRLRCGGWRRLSQRSYSASVSGVTWHG